MVDVGVAGADGTCPRDPVAETTESTEKPSSTFSWMLEADIDARPCDKHGMLVPPHRLDMVR